MDKIKVGVVGVGNMGRHHSRVFSQNPKCELVGVADVDEAAAKKNAKSCKTKYFLDHRELLGKVQAVSVNVPTSLHYAVAKDFLAQGIHVLVEKPITSDIDQARELIDLAKKNEAILQVGHIERFNAAIIKLREILTAPKFVECHRLGPFDPRIGDVGVVLDLMIHDLDILLNVVQSPIESIECVGVPILTKREDIANARIRFKNGCIANLTASRVTPVQKRKIRIFQDDAYIAINYDKQSMEVYRRVEPKDKSKGENAEIVRKKIKLKREDKLELELDHFLDCVIEGASPLVTGEQATEALDVAVQISEQIRAAADEYFPKKD